MEIQISSSKLVHQKKIGVRTAALVTPSWQERHAYVGGEKEIRDPFWHSSGQDKTKDTLRIRLKPLEECSYPYAETILFLGAL